MIDGMASKLEKAVTIRLEEKHYELLSEIALRERRSITNVARILLERGLAEIGKRGSLVEEIKAIYSRNAKS